MSALRKDHIQAFGSEEIPAQNWCETQIKVQKVNYVWVIHNYHFHKNNMIKGEKLKSPLFWNTLNDKCKWCLEIDPNGLYYDFRSHSQLCLNLDSTSKCEKVLANYKISVLDENQKELKIFAQSDEAQKFLAKTEFCCCFPIKNYDIRLKWNDTLRIYCEITFSEMDPPTSTFIQFNSINPHPDVPELRVVNDIKQLFKNEEFTDIVVSTKDKNFKAHKTILVARSPVFAAMFKHENMKETRENKIDIPDFDEKVVEEMMNYIYTGKPENLETLAADLLAIADKYGLDGLKDISENSLVENLSMENVIDLLLLADLHRACNLKTKTIDFIMTKATEVMKTTGWKNIASSHPKLLLEVCEEALFRQIDCKLATKNT